MLARHLRQRLWRERRLDRRLGQPGERQKDALRRVQNGAEGGSDGDDCAGDSGDREDDDTAPQEAALEVADVDLAADDAKEQGLRQKRPRVQQVELRLAGQLATCGKGTGN